MTELLWMAVGIYFGYKLKQILDRPYDIPETTMQYLANNPAPPKCNWCLADDCNERPEPGGYFCAEHKHYQTAN